jgi:hypothetical protein
LASHWPTYVSALLDAAGSPGATARHRHSFGHASNGFTSISPPPSSGAPFSSPSLPPRQGLPPLPNSSRQQNFGAALAAAAAAANGGYGSQAAAVPAAPAADQMMSLHLQDALFVGSPAMPSPSAAQQAAALQHQALFAALAPGGSSEQLLAGLSGSLASAIGMGSSGGSLGSPGGCAADSASEGSSGQRGGDSDEVRGWLPCWLGSGAWCLGMSAASLPEPQQHSCLELCPDP